MKFLSTFSLFLASVVVTANPIAPRDADTAQTFRLKTSQANLPNHNNLYVYAYHTGAGLNDAVLTSDVGTASPAILNDTTVQFELGTSFPWGFILGSDTNYAGMLCSPDFDFVILLLSICISPHTDSIFPFQHGSSSRSTPGPESLDSLSTDLDWYGMEVASEAGWVSRVHMAGIRASQLTLFSSPGYSLRLVP